MIELSLQKNKKTHLFVFDDKFRCK